MHDFTEPSSSVFDADVYSFTRWGVLGWAWLPASPDRAISVEAVLDGVVIATAIASEPRPDIAATGRHNGRCGFSIGFHKPLAGDRTPVLRLRLDDTAITLPERDWSEFEGYVDEVTAWGATGWCWKPAKPEQGIEIEAKVANEVIGRAVARHPRYDVGKSGRGHDLCGFVLVFSRPLGRSEEVVFCATSGSSSAILPATCWSEIVGFVDGLTRQTAVGWVWRPETPDVPLTVEAVLDGEVIGCAIADQFLEHLANVGRGSGCYGFAITFDHKVTGTATPTVRVHLGEGGMELPGVLAFPPEVPEVEGAVDFLSRHSATGWAWLPAEPEQAVIIQAVLDERPVGTTVADQLRTDLASGGKGTGRYGFTLLFSAELTSPQVPTLRVHGPAGPVVLPGPAAFADAPKPAHLHLQTSTQVENVTPANVEGSVDYLGPNSATGWAWLPAEPGRAVIVQAISPEGQLGSAVANQLREDLAQWGKGTGCYGFTLSFTRPLGNGERPVFQAQGAAGEWVALPVPAVTELAIPAVIATTQSPAAEIEGNVDRMTRWEAAGWAWLPSAPDAIVEIRAILNGKVIGHAVADEFRQDLADWGKGTGRYGFHLIFNVPIAGELAPSLQPYVPTRQPLPGKGVLPPSGPEDLAARPRGTLETLLREHGEFTSAGPEFEEFDPSILVRSASPSAASREPWLIAFYLPQFHAIPENDRFWGVGFTEWRQLPRAISRFPGHYQPRVPRDLGFYNLLAVEALERQFALAKAAGINIFAYYYYWFNRMRVLEKPLDALLASDLDVPFMIIWANENWTRTWDGSEASVLLRQDYRTSDDLALITDLARHFVDQRYVRINDRPLFVIYNPSNIPNTSRTIARWRRLFRTKYALEPLIFMAQTFGVTDPRPFGLDGAFEFPPHKITHHLPGRKMPDAYSEDFSGRVIDYEDFAMASLHEEAPPYPLVKTAVPSWDNESRRPNRGMTLERLSPHKYETWIRGLIQNAIRKPVLGQPIVAINAWNEWAEGAYLEPDVYFGAAFLNATARARVAAPSYQMPAGEGIAAVRRPGVTVILPNYNHAAFIVERIESILCQSVRPNEIIFLDDCSRDNSFELARQTLQSGDIPFRMLANTENSGGVFRQWMKGIELAKHDLIWVAETDDSAHPDFLMHILPQFELEEVAAAFGQIRCIDADGNPLADLDGYFDGMRDFAWKNSTRVPAYRAFAYDFTVKNIIPNASGLVFRKPKLTSKEIERLYEYRFAGDWYFYALQLRGGSLAYCRAAQSYFRINGGSASRSAFFTDRHLTEHRMVIADLWHEYAVSTAAVAAHAKALAQHLTDRSGQEIEALLKEPLQLDARTHPLRVCIAANSFEVGGGEVLPLELANELRRLGNHVTYLCIERADDSHKTIRTRLRGDVPIVYWKDVQADFSGFLKDYGIEVFNSHNVSIDYRLALREQEFAIPYVASLHGGYETVKGLLNDEVLAYLVRTVSSWLYLSEKNLGPLQATGLTDAQVRRSFNAVPNYNGQWVDRATFRAAHGIALDAFVLLLCSRAIEEKGWSIAADVAAAVAKATKRDIRLVLIGDGPAAKAIRARPEAKRRHLTFLGHVDLPIRYFQCCDAGIFPSTFAGETFPLFLLECFAAGLPVVSTDIGEIGHIMGEVVANRPGATVPHNEDRNCIVSAMTKELVELVRDRGLYKRMCDNAQATASRFSIEQLGAAYIQEFGRVKGEFSASTRDVALQPELKEAGRR